MVYLASSPKPGDHDAQQRPQPRLSIYEGFASRT